MTLRCARLGVVAAWGVLLPGCAHGAADAEPEARPIMAVAAERPVCGWETLAADMPRVVVSQGGPGEPAHPGASVLVVTGDDEASYGAVKQALAPAASTLVRVKVVVEERWLLPVTHRRPVHPHPPAQAERWVSMVGKRKITRSRQVPAQRFADLRLEGDRARVHIENEAPGGSEVPVAELAALLRRTEPPVSMFALTATEATAWKHVVAALVAAACYDRKPGQEPHEVLLD